MKRGKNCHFPFVKRIIYEKGNSCQVCWKYFNMGGKANRVLVGGLDLLDGGRGFSCMNLCLTICVKFFLMDSSKDFQYWFIVSCSKMGRKGKYVHKKIIYVCEIPSVIWWLWNFFLFEGLHRCQKGFSCIFRSGLHCHT